MPLVILRTDPRFVSDDARAAIAKRLPRFVVEGLSCQEGPLEEKDIGILMRHIDPDTDIGFSVVSITVIANDYPERRRLVERAASHIDGAIRGDCLHSGQRCAVWILLGVGAYKES